MHYLDNAATTKVLPEVGWVVAEVMARHFANPSSLYGPGMEAEQVISTARAQVAAAMGLPLPLDLAHPQVVFTGSGTEANNIAILGTARARQGWGTHLLATGYEHPSVTGPLQMLAQREGFTLEFVNPDETGRVNPAALAARVTPQTALVCAMQVNNETGALLDVATLAKAVKATNRRTAVHVDGVQGFGKRPALLPCAEIDTYAVSGHKLHAPKGVGALYIRKGFSLYAPFAGGAQEGGVRPGTENTPYIAAFGEAARRAVAGREAALVHMQALQKQLLAGLWALPGVVLNSPDDAFCGVVNFSIPGLRSETMLHFLEARQVYVSSGSACARGEASHTLTAMGLSPERVDSALRVSLSGENTPEDIDALLCGLHDGLETLARATTSAARK